MFTYKITPKCDILDGGKSIKDILFLAYNDVHNADELLKERLPFVDHRSPDVRQHHLIFHMFFSTKMFISFQLVYLRQLWPKASRVCLACN